MIEKIVSMLKSKDPEMLRLGIILYFEESQDVRNRIRKLVVCHTRAGWKYYYESVSLEKCIWKKGEDSVFTYHNKLYFYKGSIQLQGYTNIEL